MRTLELRARRSGGPRRARQAHRARATRKARRAARASCGLDGLLELASVLLKARRHKQSDAMSDREIKAAEYCGWSGISMRTVVAGCDSIIAIDIQQEGGCDLQIFILSNKRGQTSLQDLT